MDETQNYIIADFPVKMNCRTEAMQKLTAPYRTQTAQTPMLDLSIPRDQWARLQQQETSPAMLEYNRTFYQFACQIIEQKAFCFHAAALSVDGAGILFSADSGTGKSTHARLWQECMHGHTILNLNDDKPIIRLLDGTAWAYGSPWSGKHSIHHNSRAPVKALVFLERGKTNQIQRLAPDQIFSRLFPQVLWGQRTPERLSLLLDLLDQFVRSIAVYRLQCNVSEEAVRLVYETVWKQ